MAGIQSYLDINHDNINGVTIISRVYVVFALIVWLSTYFETLHLAYAGQGILYKLRTQLFDHLQNLSMSFFDRNKVGKLMSRVQNDVDQLQTLMTQDIIRHIGQLADVDRHSRDNDGHEPEAGLDYPDRGAGIGHHPVRLAVVRPACLHQGAPGHLGGQ